MPTKKKPHKINPVTNPNLKKAAAIGIKNPTKLKPKQEQGLSGGILERVKPKKG